MAKKNSTAGRGNGGTTTDALHRRLVAFAEQLGRVAGAVQSKAEDWTNHETLSAQLASVRDAAAELLAHLASTVKKTAARTAAKKTARKPAKKAAKAAPKAKPAASSAGGASKGRSGGVVDAPGKKHRKPLPGDPEANVADSQAAKMRTAMPMAKTTRLRGRG